MNSSCAAECACDDRPAAGARASRSEAELLCAASRTGEDPHVGTIKTHVKRIRQYCEHPKANAVAGDCIAAPPARHTLAQAEAARQTRGLQRNVVRTSAWPAASISQA